MIEALNIVINYLLANDFICFAAALITFILGCFGGYHVATSKNKVKTPPNTGSTAHCDIRGKYEFIEFTEPKLFFKPKITKYSCPFYEKGICAKNNAPCFLITQYSENYFKKL